MASKNEETPVVGPVAPRSRTGLLVGGIIGGSVLVAAVLFGGGVLLGLHLPHGGDRVVFSQGEVFVGEGHIEGLQQRPDHR